MKRKNDKKNKAKFLNLLDTLNQVDEIDPKYNYIIASKTKSDKLRIFSKHSTEELAVKKSKTSQMKKINFDYGVNIYKIYRDPFKLKKIG